jgi:predicted nucleic-acid-binding Zn-ribbon protein
MSKLKCPKCGCEIKNPIASAGGKKSKREITPAQQAKMQEAVSLARQRKKAKK